MGGPVLNSRSQVLVCQLQSRLDSVLTHHGELWLKPGSSSAPRLWALSPSAPQTSVLVQTTRSFRNTHGLSDGEGRSGTKSLTGGVRVCKADSSSRTQRAEWVQGPGGTNLQVEDK